MNISSLVVTSGVYGNGAKASGGLEITHFFVGMIRRECITHLALRMPAAQRAAAHRRHSDSTLGSRGTHPESSDAQGWPGRPGAATGGPEGVCMMEQDLLFRHVFDHS